jgi:hypothetical protein
MLDVPLTDLCPLMNCRNPSVSSVCPVHWFSRLCFAVDDFFLKLEIMALSQIYLHIKFEFLFA